MGRANNTAHNEQESSNLERSEKISKINTKYSVLNDEALNMLALSIEAERMQKIKKIKKQIAKGNYRIASPIVAQEILNY